jgi:hypothetical protein
MGDEPQTSRTGLRYHGPISVHPSEFIKLSYQFSVISCQLKTITDQRSKLGAHQSRNERVGVSTEY